MRVTTSTTSLLKMALKGRRSPGMPGKVKPFVEMVSGYNIFRKTGRVHRMEQVVDRENNRYYKHVEDAETGEVVKHQEEPLTEHVSDHQKRQQRGT